MNQIFDTHCHYNLEPLYSGKTKFFSESQTRNISHLNWQDHWQRAQKKGVAAGLVAGTNLESGTLAIDIAQQEKMLFASVGLNPVDFKCSEKDDLIKAFDQIKGLAKQKKVIAIGETGIDYYRLDSSAKSTQLKELQQEIFIRHIQLANDVKKPLIIHARDSADEAYHTIIDLLKEHYQCYKPFVLHCVSGPKKYIAQALELGAYVSFAGNITYPNAQDLQSLIHLIPKDRLMIETDAPFLPPQDKRGRINLPQYIIQTANYLKQKHQLNLKQVYQNSLNFFEIED